ncbi:ATP-binding protein [Alicyclobacillus fodiniaquatilis]|uniref:histidine kinase n=1 Tax=Alicyclobacillus fodiniaquatilis TaxID=1661150 RepID=A0ABW4JIZ7_9BACL
MIWRSLRVKLVLVYTLLILFAVELIGAYFVRTLTNSLINTQSKAAENQAELMATLVAPQIDDSAKQISGSITSVLQSIPQFLNGTVYMLSKDGYVIYTSAGGALVGQKRTDSVATQALLHKKNAVAVRFDPLTRQHLLAVAVPVLQQGKFAGILEYVLPVQVTYETIRQVTTIFYTGSGLVLVLTIILGAILSRALTRPVLDVTRQARVMAGGDFSRRLEGSSNDEFGDLVQAINHLADELDEALAANRREQERLRAIITSMGEGVIVLDSACAVLFMNHAARRLLAVEGVDAQVAVVSRLGLMEMLEQAKNGDCADVRVVGGAVLHIILTSIRLREQSEGFVAVVRDVTEQERLNQARRDFVSNVSHELRTPLTSIKSYLEALSDLREDEQETRQSFLAVIGQETDRMVRLTRDLLQLSGLDRGQVQATHQMISITDLLQQISQRFYLQAQRQQLTLDVQPVQTQAFIFGNRDMLNRILDNLVSNAVKYTPPHGHVTVFAKIEPQRVHILVKDDGIGIPTADLPHVFERFYRVDKGRSRRLGGTGLGLALAREMAQRLGGEIEMTSEVGVGTCVQVSFDRAKEVPAET